MGSMFKKENNKKESKKIVFVGNFRNTFCSEVHHAKSLEALGHTVLRLQETEATSEAILGHAMKSDALVFVHTHGWDTPGTMSLSDVFGLLRSKGIPTLTYHLDLWFGLKRQDDLKNDDFYKTIEYFFTVDKLMADWFNENTNVKGVFLPAGVFHEEVYMDQPFEQTIDLIFVGSKQYHSEWPYRKILIDNLQRRYGNRFRLYGKDGRGNVRGEQLNKLYGQTKIVVGDTLCIGFNYPYYMSDRIFETIGRGGFIIHPHIEGIEDFFEIGKELVTYKYNDFNDLYRKIEFYHSNPGKREEIRKAGFERVKRDHTYLNRWEKIIDEIY